MFKTRLNSVTIDKCYLDTTYFDPIYNNIPSKANALNAIKRLIEKKIETSHTLPVFAIEVSKIGKEDLLIDLCLHFDTKIAVSFERYQRYASYLTNECMQNIFTTSLKPNTLFYVYNDEEYFLNQLRLRHNQFIILTKALIYSNNDSVIHLKLSLNKLVNYYIYNSDIETFQLPYSEHSSYSQIIDFIKQLKPKKIIPHTRDLDMSRFNQYLTADKRQFFCSPCWTLWYNVKPVK